MTSPFRGRQINKRNIRQYIIHSALPNIQKLLINISINFQKRWLTFETQPKDENPLGSAALRLHADGSNNMRYPIFSSFKKSDRKYWEARSKSFAGRQICVFASIQLTGGAQNETNFHVKTNIPCTASALSEIEQAFHFIANQIFSPPRQICIASLFRRHGNGDHCAARRGGLFQLPGLQPRQPNSKFLSSPSPSPLSL